MSILKSLVELTFSPVGLMVWCFLGGWLFGFFKRLALWRPRLLAAGTILYLLYTFTPLAEVLIAGLEHDHQPIIALDQVRGLETIAVLSGYGREVPGIPITSALSDETQARVAEGIRLYRMLPGAKLLFSGGTLRPGDAPYARLMAEYARALGVDGNDVLIEDRSQTTYENLVEVKMMLGEKPFLLVTSAYHLGRAMAIARKLGMRPIAAPACIRTLQSFPADQTWGEWSRQVVKSFAYPSIKRLTLLQLACHEHIGYWWYKLLGRV